MLPQRSQRAPHVHTPQFIHIPSLRLACLPGAGRLHRVFGDLTHSAARVLVPIPVGPFAGQRVSRTPSIAKLSLRLILVQAAAARRALQIAESFPVWHSVFRSHLAAYWQYCGTLATARSESVRLNSLIPLRCPSSAFRVSLQGLRNLVLASCRNVRVLCSGYEAYDQDELLPRAPTGNSGPAAPASQFATNQL